MSAGHPPPLVFSREFDRFVEVSQDRLVSYPPIGLQPGEHHADAKRYERALGYKKRYTVNNLNLMGHGDVLLLYTDGLIEPLSAYTQDQLAQAVSRAKDGSAQTICEAIVAIARPPRRRPTTSRSSSSSTASVATISRPAPGLQRRGRRYRLDVVQAGEIDRDPFGLGQVSYPEEVCAPDDVGLVVAPLRVHRLGERFVSRGNQADDFRVRAGERLRREPAQRAPVGDRVDDDPVQGHEDDGVPFEGELVEAAAASAVLSSIQRANETTA